MEEINIDNEENYTKVIRINSIVDNPSPVESMYMLEECSLLAVGRSNNTIEVWNINNWIQLIKIFGNKSNQVRRVFMLLKKDENANTNLFEKLRLFSIGLNGYLVEWGIDTMDIKVRLIKKNK
jgi:hypothetical protein